MDAAEVLENAKQLDRAQIAGIVHELLGVLDDAEHSDVATTAHAAWKEELHRRVEEIQRGDVELVDGRTTIALARAELESRRTS